MDARDDEHGGMVDMYGGMVDYGGVNVVKIESRLGMDITKPTIRWGPKSRTGKSQVIGNKKRKISQARICAARCLLVEIIAFIISYILA